MFTLSNELGPSSSTSGINSCLLKASKTVPHDLTRDKLLKATNKAKTLTILAKFQTMNAFKSIVMLLISKMFIQFTTTSKMLSTVINGYK